MAWIWRVLAAAGLAAACAEKLTRFHAMYTRDQMSLLLESYFIAFCCSPENLLDEGQNFRCWSPQSCEDR